jgi:hypothetical protein
MSPPLVDDTVACVLEIREARASDLDAVVALMAQLGGEAPLAPGQARAIFDRYPVTRTTGCTWRCATAGWRAASRCW